MYVQVIHTFLVVVGSSHRQSVEVHEVSSRILTPAIIAYSIAAICEQASPTPAMQLQCAHIRSDASPWLEWRLTHTLAMFNLQIYIYNCTIHCIYMHLPLLS